MTNQSDDADRRIKDAKEAGEGPSSTGNLALLYEGLFTGIVRLQASRQNISDGESFRRRTKTTLQEIEHVAVHTGYDAADIKDAHYAVVAFLDSVILHSSDAVRAEWERQPLQEEMFGHADAGVVFFQKLEQFHSRRDSEQLANILEVYLLCLLLGFEGQYSGGLRGELEAIVERTRRRIEKIRGRKRELSPTSALPTETKPSSVAESQRTNRLPLITLVAVIFTIVLFIVMKIDLVWSTAELRSKLP
jgi:type VI secretion system protein ImpK